MKRGKQGFTKETRCHPPTKTNKMAVFLGPTTIFTRRKGEKGSGN